MPERVLVIGAHTDDVESMCGGSIARFIDRGKEVHYASFSFADKSLTMEFGEGTTRKEVVEATDVLGIHFLDMNLYDYEVRVFPKYRQEILEDLVRLRKELNPYLVITHNSNDTHQDHKVISDETYRAFKKTSTIWGYESFYNNRMFKNDIYVKLHEKHINKKLLAMSKYESQLVKYDNRDGIIGLATFRGAQIECKYAECFEAMRIIV